MAQLMPLPLTVSCFSKIQIDFTFLVPAHLGSRGQRAVKCVCVCVCVCVCACVLLTVLLPGRRCASAGNSYGPMSVCVCLSQVGVLLKQINESGWFFGMRASIDLSYTVF